MPNKLLKLVNFIQADETLLSGLVPVKDKSSIRHLNIDEQAVIIEARTFKRIDYVFFRRFSDSRSSQVSAYVVDNSDNQLDIHSLAELHHQVWLQGTAPLLYITGDSQIDILACARGPDFWNERKQRCDYKPAKEFKSDLLKTTSQISDEMKKFSALRLADGTFWDDPDNRNLANHDKAAHQSLIQAVVETDKDLGGKNNPVLRRLLLLMVLVKYLEDRGVFPNGWFGRFHKGSKNFFEVLQGGDTTEVNRLLLFLESKFNGDIFDLSRLDLGKLTKTTLSRFANLVNARMLKRQRYLWDQFSFEHLPVEIISHLYQRFVKDGHGAVYTPHFLAALLLDHIMPYKRLTGKERILDPACGSAVFLVGAFRRLVNLWRSQHNWKKPTVETLKEILKNSIHGVDLDSSAIDLSAFSLSLAICDALKPKVIWNKLKFDYLRSSNLFEKDFFELLLETKNGVSNIFVKKFDIIVGNPPFESELTSAAKEIDKIESNKDISRGKCPDNQAAYLFLEQAFNVLIPNKGQVCLIQPMGFLYNSNVNIFRRKIFKNYEIKTVLDFISIRNLYEADAKTVAVFAQICQPAKDHWIEHWTFRRTVSVHQRICFELDHYDRHRILQKNAEDNPNVWRVNLLGGGRLFDILQRFCSMRTLKKYMVQKGWNYNGGFTVGNRKGTASFLKGKNFLPANALTSKGIDEHKIQPITETHFERPRKEINYTPPLVLIRKLESLPIGFWDKDFLAYTNSIIGIHAPKKQVSELLEFFNFFRDKHNIYKFACILNGGEFSATACSKQRIDKLPHPDDIKDYSFSFWEYALCDDVLKYITEYIRLGQNSKLLRKSADINVLKEYSDIFLRMLGSVYKNINSSSPIFLSGSGLACQPFYFGDSPELQFIDENSESELAKLVYYEKHVHLRTLRIIRFYDRNVILIIKPDRLRYWIRSVAIKDADETLIDLYHQGY